MEKNKKIKHSIIEMGSVTSKFLISTITYLSSESESDPLFSIVVVLYSLILLYFPRIFLNLIFSPVLISTGILLSTLFRFGSIQQTTIEEEEEVLHLPDEDLDLHLVMKEEDDEKAEMGFSSKEYFVEWNVSLPLEVIHEDHDGEMGISGLRSLELYYSESDTESSSDGDFPGIDQGWDSPENMGFRWEEEGGLIEIELGGDYQKRKEDFDDRFVVQVCEEENWIEIEISGFGSPMNKRREFQLR